MQVSLTNSNKHSCELIKAGKNRLQKGETEGKGAYRISTPLLKAGVCICAGRLLIGFETDNNFCATTAQQMRKITRSLHVAWQGCLLCYLGLETFGFCG